MKQMHPLLPATTAAEYAHRAGLALQSRGHAPGLDCTLVNEGDETTTVLEWDMADGVAGQQLDRIRVTEDGAEAVALVLAHVARQWVVRRRLQRGEFADWLLSDATGDLVALEVSGIDGAPDARRLEEKLGQVTQVTICVLRSACVVAFGPPLVALASVK